MRMIAIVNALLLGLTLSSYAAEVELPNNDIGTFFMCVGFYHELGVNGTRKDQEGLDYIAGSIALDQMGRSLATRLKMSDERAKNYSLRMVELGEKLYAPSNPGRTEQLKMLCSSVEIAHIGEGL
jgi:hypothetical protein